MNGEDVGIKPAFPRRQSNTGSGSGSRRQPAVTVDLLDASDDDDPSDINVVFHRAASHKELKV